MPLETSWAGLVQAQEEVPGHFKAEPAAGHAGSDLEEVRHEAFVHSSDPFLSHDRSYGIPD